MSSGHFPSTLADAEAKVAGGPRPFFPTRTWLNPGKFAGLLSQSMDTFFRLHSFANQSINHHLHAKTKRSLSLLRHHCPPAAPSAVPRRPRRLLCLSDEKERRTFVCSGRPRIAFTRNQTRQQTPTRRPVSAPITAGACRNSPPDQVPSTEPSVRPVSRPDTRCSPPSRGQHLDSVDTLYGFSAETLGEARRCTGFR